MAEQAAINPYTQSAEALVSRMLDVATYPHLAVGLQMIETHLSWVFLTGGFAYKVHKPVKLDFADFLTPLARQIDCEEECRLNRRFTPTPYPGVVPISNDSITEVIRVDGQDTSGEYAACMCRFAQQDVLIALARDGRLRLKEIDALADLAADLHATAPVANASSDDGVPSGTRRTFRDYAVGVIALRHALLDTTITVPLLRQHIVRLEETSALRRRSRHTREYHGDLHLGNAVLIGGQPTPFDCLGFSPSLWWINTMHDTAFPLMNLLAIGLGGLAY